MAFPLPEKPSIAVLPFDNMSGDPNQEYLSDGLSEEIITALSKLPYLLVIACNSSFSYKGKPVKIRQVAEEAITLDPNSATTYAMLGHTLRMGGRPDEAILAYKKAIRLNPIPPTFYLFGLGHSYSLAGQYEEGIKWCEKAVRQAPDEYIARVLLTAVYSWAGRDEDARAEAKEVLRINPKISLAKIEKRAKYKYKDRMIEALRKAGLPE